MSVSFVHLHVHTQYSLLDGAIRVSDLINRTVEMGLDSVALTDHGNMFGAVYFYQAARDVGVKPIIGCEVYLAPGNRRDKGHSNGSREIAYHLVLLAKNLEGYKKLTRLVSTGFIDGFYYKPRIDLELLKEHHKGLIALSGCLKGRIPRLLYFNQLDRAQQIAEELALIMGEGNFFLELQDTGLSDQKKINPGLIYLSERLGIGLVATNDCHFLLPEDFEAHEVLLCIQTGKTLEDPDRMNISSESFYKSPQEMKLLFNAVPEAISNTLLIAKSCEIELPLGDSFYTFPRFFLDNENGAASFLRLEANKGLEVRFAEKKSHKQNIDEIFYIKRLNYELEVLTEVGFSDYFLVVADFINWAKENKIPVGPGRGSVAGSLVAWALGITELDPILYGLIFERFLNKERVSLPDIDVDFCYERRQEVLEYVIDKYGEANVAQIITFGSMQARAVVRDVGRVINMSYNEIDQIAKLIPSVSGISLDESIEKEPRLKERIETDYRIYRLFKIARVLEGLPRHVSIHAAGVVISRVPLIEVVPLYRGANDEIVTQFDMKCIEKLGLLKFDFLGLRTLTVINMATYMVQINYDSNFCINMIPMNDYKTYQLLSQADTNGVFQFESSGMRELLVKLRPECFEDLIALVALYRPGPLESGMVDDFIARKYGEKEVIYLLPQLESILSETYGVIIYQEQIMEIARILAGYSLGEGDILRRAIAKKDPLEMANQRSRFINGVIKKGINYQKAEQLFDLIEKFANYGFNKSHSAAYAFIAYQTAYLKIHHSLEFMAALLTIDANNTDEVVKHINECYEQKLTVLQPDINKSQYEFSVDDKAVRFGLSAIKNLGISAIDNIIYIRKKEGKFVGLNDFCERIDLRKVNRRMIESLIKSGAFDFTTIHRAQLIAMLDECIERGQKLFRDRVDGQIYMFSSFKQRVEDKQDVPLCYKFVSVWSEADMLAYEKEVFGFYFTSHPLNRYKDKIKSISNFNTLNIKEVDDRVKVSIAGVITDIKEKITKAGHKMALLRLEDLYSSIKVVLLPDCYLKNGQYLSVNNSVLIDGLVDKNEYEVKVKGIKIVKLESILNNNNDKEGELKLILKLTELTNYRLIQFRQILIKYPGKYRIFLHIIIPDEGVVILILPNQYMVDSVPEFIEQVDKLFGRKVIESLLVI